MAFDTHAHRNILPYQTTIFQLNIRFIVNKMNDINEHYKCYIQ